MATMEVFILMFGGGWSFIGYVEIFRPILVGIDTDPQIYLIL